MPLADALHAEYLTKHIPYRLDTIAGLRIGLDLLHTWGGSAAEAKLSITFNGKDAVQGNGASLTNGMIEMGLIASRVMLNFIGIGYSWKTGNLCHYSAAGDDVTIESFKDANGVALKSVSPADACAYLNSLWTNTTAELIADGLATTMVYANKAVAHLTSGPPTSHDFDVKFRIASDMVPLLVENYLYGGIGMPVPNWKRIRIGPKPHSGHIEQAQNVGS